MSSKALVIFGPTASGKSDAAVRVARALDGEVISMDSRQVYRRMDIGTAKPTVHERAGIPHHGFDLIDPHERFNAGRFAALAHEWIDAVRDRRRVPVVAGGTGFFLRALTHPMFEEPEMDAGSKEQCKRLLSTFDTVKLQRWAAALDPEASPGLDRQRLARVIEIALLTGHTLSWWQRHAAPQRAGLEPLVVVLDLPADLLRERIDRRVDAMIAAGLADEVRRLLADGLTERDPGLRTTGYTEMIPFLRGEYGIDEAAERIRIATRQYARRQRTWIRHQLPAGAHRVDGARPADTVAADIVRIWQQETK